MLKLIETVFSNFMEKDNLFVNADGLLVFYDRKYGFVFKHDIEHDFEAEYVKIYQKYMRRAEWFMQAVREPTCFIRAVRSEQEIIRTLTREFIFSGRGYMENGSVCI